MPIFTDSNAGGAYSGTGMILRPGASPLECGKAGDAGGHCNGRNWCPPLSSQEEVTYESAGKWGYNGDGCGKECNLQLGTWNS